MTKNTRPIEFNRYGHEVSSHCGQNNPYGCGAPLDSPDGHCTNVAFHAARFFKTRDEGVVPMTDRKYGNFNMVTVRKVDGPKQYPCEHTPNPHLVISARAVDDEGRPAFGGWTIVVVPHELTLPIPQPHCDDVETMRWIANQLAKADIDWTAPRDVLTAAVMPVYRDLIRRADEEDAKNTIPGVIPASTLRQICEANARVVGRKAGE